MEKISTLIVASVAVLSVQSVLAADYPYPPQPQPLYQPQPIYPQAQPQYQPPPPVYQPPPQVYAPPPPPPIYVPPPQGYAPPPPPPLLALRGGVGGELSGWYLRGDIGVGAQRFRTFDFTQTNFGGFTWPASWRIEQKDIKDTTFFALGLGYQWNSWLRFDLTGEYRTSAKGKALGSYLENCPGGGKCFDLYDFDHQAAVFLANAYVDLGTWWCFTPFFGVGLGAAYHTFDAMTDIGFVNTQSPGFGYASATSHDTTFAWALHAGVAYEISKSLKVELAYRYLDLGSPNTSIINCSNGGCGVPGGPRAFYTLTDFTSNELKLGIRWMIDCCDVPPPPPLYQPPLMRRG